MGIVGIIEYPLCIWSDKDLQQFCYVGIELISLQQIMLVHSYVLENRNAEIYRKQLNLFPLCLVFPMIKLTNDVCEKDLICNLCLQVSFWFLNKIITQ